MILEMHDEVLKLAAAVEAEGFWESDKELFQLLREFVTVVRVLVYSSEHGLVVNAGLRERLKTAEQVIVELGGTEPPCRFPCPMPS